MARQKKQTTLPATAAAFCRPSRQLYVAALCGTALVLLVIGLVLTALEGKGFGVSATISMALAVLVATVAANALKPMFALSAQLRRMKASGELVRAEQDFSSAREAAGTQGHVRMGEHYLFCLGSAHIIAYSEIESLTRTVQQSGATTGALSQPLVTLTAMCGGKPYQVYSLLGGAADEDIFARLHVKNPEAVINR